MTPYDMIRDQISKSVPFARHAGVVITSLADGQGKGRLEQTDTSINHIGSQHAGALFTLGEAASGAALAGAFASVLFSVRAVAGRADIAFTKVAKGRISATASTSEPGCDLLAVLQAEGRVAFDVAVSMTDEAGDEVAQMTVAWHVKKT